MSKINNQKRAVTIINSLISLGILAFVALAAAPSSVSAATYAPYNEPSLYQSATINAPSENPRPNINSISPKSANVGSGGKTVTVTGSNFIPNSIVRWNGSNRPTTFIDYSHVLVQLYPSDMVGSSGRYITVFNPGPGGGYSNSSFFTLTGYVAPSSNTPVRTTTTSTSTSTNSNSNYYNTANTNYAADNNYYDNNGNPVEQPAPEQTSNLASNAIFGSSGSFGPSGLIQWVMFAILILLIIILVRKFVGADKAYFATPLKHD